MATEELKQQFRYHFGQLWNMTPNPSIRKVSLCSDSSLKTDYSKQWSEYSIKEQDAFIEQAMWGESWNSILGIKYETPKESTK